MIEKLLKMMVLLILLTGCEIGEGNIVRVCADYGTTYKYCGTGFFISDQDLKTAKHVVDEACSGELTVVTTGVNPKTKKFTRAPLGIDSVTAHFKPGTTDNYCPVCESIVADKEVVMLGIIDWRRQIKKVRGHMTIREDGKLLIDAPVKPGFSGGPVVDEDRWCVVGVISGVNEDGHTVAELVL